jgi:Family of unknown function (DUF6491)
MEVRTMPSKATLAVILLLAFAGCSAEKGVTDIRPTKFPELTLDCIFINTIDAWRELDPYHVIIDAPDRSTHYLLELSDYCQPLAMHPESIRISSHQSGLLCAQDRDALIVGGQRCSILAIVPYRMGEQPKAVK